MTHLRVVYEKLLDRLAREGRTDWVQEEMAALTDPTLYRADPEANVAAAEAAPEQPAAGRVAARDCRLARAGGPAG